MLDTHKPGSNWTAPSWCSQSSPGAEYALPPRASLRGPGVGQIDAFLTSAPSVTFKILQFRVHVCRFLKKKRFLILEKCSPELVDPTWVPQVKTLSCPAACHRYPHPSVSPWEPTSLSEMCVVSLVSQCHSLASTLYQLIARVHSWTHSSSLVALNDKRTVCTLTLSAFSLGGARCSRSSHTQVCPWRPGRGRHSLCELPTASISTWCPSVDLNTKGRPPVLSE